MSGTSYLDEAKMLQPKVAILMCTLNGAPFLKEQLLSFVSQTHKNWVLWVSDDGSSDQTLNILQRVQADWGSDRIKIVQGPGKGFAANFLSIACRAEIAADYYAFSDQDDVWLPLKLQRAIDLLKNEPQENAVLYGSRTQLTDAAGKVLGLSTLTPRFLNFRNALVQNVASGNTMVFNNSLRDLVRVAGPQLNIVSHDWWLYLLTTACNGKVVFDQEPFINYRQHKHNLIGASASLPAKMNRFKGMFSGQLKRWIKQNHICLTVIEHRLPPDNVQAAKALAAIHSSKLFRRIKLFKDSGVRRQSPIGTFSLLAAALLKQL
jgi:glycosyltransferase involved in cell wall biosynthesis